MPVGRQRLLWIGLGVAVVAAIAVAVLLAPGSRSGAHPAPGAGGPALTQGAADTLSAELSSGREDQLRRALAVPDTQKLDPRAADQLRALGPITFDVRTFHALDATDATVSGTVAHPPAGQPGSWIFTLVLDSGTWKVVDAEPAR